MHAGTSNRRAYGFFRGFMRSILQLRTSQNGGGNSGQNRANGTDGGLNGTTVVESASPAIRFRDPQIEMAHGAGGKASRRLVEGLFAPLLSQNSNGTLGDAAHLNIEGGSIAVN